MASIVVAVIGCGDVGAAQRAADSTLAAQRTADSLAAAMRARAPVLLGEARSAMASLLKDSTRAAFDSLRVVEPPPVEGREQPLAVCGRLGGPWSNGPSGSRRFIYQSRTTVFVEDATNAGPFGEVWAKGCGNAGAKVLAP